MSGRRSGQKIVANVKRGMARIREANFWSVSFNMT